MSERATKSRHEFLEWPLEIVVRRSIEHPTQKAGCCFFLALFDRIWSLLFLRSDMRRKRHPLLHPTVGGVLMAVYVWVTMTTVSNGASDHHHHHHHRSPSPVATSTTSSRRHVYVAGFFPLSGVTEGAVGRGVLPAVKLAREHINKNSSVLKGYQLEILWNDTAVRVHLVFV